MTENHGVGGSIPSPGTTNQRAWLALIAPLILSACDFGTSASAPAVPAGHLIRPADVNRDPPTDRCQHLDRLFVMKLVQRLDMALAEKGRGPASFQEFNVVPDPSGRGGPVAVVRFTSGRADGPDEMISAFGTFTPSTCAIGTLAFHQGAITIDAPLFDEGPEISSTGVMDQ